MVSLRSLRFYPQSLKLLPRPLPLLRICCTEKEHSRSENCIFVSDYSNTLSGPGLEAAKIKKVWRREYLGYKTKLDWECKNGYKYVASPEIILRLIMVQKIKESSECQSNKPLVYGGLCKNYSIGQVVPPPTREPMVQWHKVCNNRMKFH